MQTNQVTRGASRHHPFFHLLCVDLSNELDKRSGQVGQADICPGDTLLSISQNWSSVDRQMAYRGGENVSFRVRPTCVYNFTINCVVLEQSFKLSGFQSLRRWNNEEFYHLSQKVSWAVSQAPVCTRDLSRACHEAGFHSLAVMVTAQPPSSHLPILFLKNRSWAVPILHPQWVAHLSHLPPCATDFRVFFSLP